MRFVAALEEEGDPRLAVTTFGTSPQGRDLPLLILSTKGVWTPREAREAGQPVVLVINGIHAGEVEGKEASLMLIRDLLADRHAEILEHLILLVVPLFNPDGNDRIDPANRKLDLAKLEGQIGPDSGVGTRVNASGINLNRDYVRHDSLEMRLLQTHVCHPWEPHLTIDCHSTNGSVHRFALTYDIPHTVESGRAEPIAFMRDRVLPEVRARLKKRTGIDTFYYGNFVADEGGSGSGWMTYPHHPRFGSNYRGLTNRLDLLLETYSYQPFPDRVRTTYEFLVETLDWVAGHAPEVLSVVNASQAPPSRIAVRYRLDSHETPVEILTREPRTLEGTPTQVDIPHFARFVGTEVVDRPWGYVVSDEMADRLAAHGLLVERLDGDADATLEIATVARADTHGARKILEASEETEYNAHYRAATRRLPTGTAVVRTDQPRGAIAVYLCEARSDDGALVNGFTPIGADGEFPIYRLLASLPLKGT
ncbi:MAG: peptidase [Armatimonadetes bacterium]|nr:peptidase [Armatimonadota bacterium]